LAGSLSVNSLKKLSLSSADPWNAGQTIRSLHRAGMVERRQFAQTMLAQQGHVNTESQRTKS
jgi:hypothetical protein